VLAVSRHSAPPYCPEHRLSSNRTGAADEVVRLEEESSTAPPENPRLPDDGEGTKSAQGAHGQVGLERMSVAINSDGKG
jgi:hypothetical protein